MHGVAVQRMPEERAEPGEHLIGGFVFLLQHQRGNGIERVEQEMGVELIAQHFELRLMRHAGRLKQAFTLILHRAVIADAKVKTAPGRKNRLRKDRYSSLLIANMSARNYIVEKNVIEYGAIGGFAMSNDSKFKNNPDKLYHGPHWFTDKVNGIY